MTVEIVVPSVEVYTMETVYNNDAHRCPEYFCDGEPGTIEVTRTNTLNNLINIQVIDLETCTVIK